MQRLGDISSDIATHKLLRVRAVAVTPLQRLQLLLYQQVFVQVKLGTC